MSYLRLFTLTGLDEATDLHGVAHLAERFAGTEWAVLLDRSKAAQQDGKGRYPREAWVREFAQFSQDNKLRSSLHLCGQDAIDFLREDKAVMDLAAMFPRVQLNVRAAGLRVADDVGVRQFLNAVRSVKGCGVTTRVILQYNESNAALWNELRRVGGYEALIDRSAGSGLLPKDWTIDRFEFSGACIGFAGGLGPDNIAEQLSSMSASAHGKAFWVGMESKLRNRYDRFDLELCERVLDEVATWQYRKLCDDALAAQERDHPQTDVQKLSGLYLDWWAGLAMGYPMVIPPHNAARAVYLSRTYGEYESFQPSEKASELEEVIEEFGVGCIREAGKSGWTGLTSAGERVQSDTRKTAILRAAVLDAFGPSLPSNLAQAPLLHAVWLGSDVSRELLIGEAAKPGP